METLHLFDALTHQMKYEVLISPLPYVQELIVSARRGAQSGEREQQGGN